MLVRQLFDFLEVELQIVHQTSKAKWQHFGIGKPQGSGARHVCQRHTVLESRITEADKMLESVIERVIAAVGTLTAKSEIRRGNTSVLQKGRVIRARAERRDAQCLA